MNEIQHLKGEGYNHPSRKNSFLSKSTKPIYSSQQSKLAPSVELFWGHVLISSDWVCIIVHCHDNDLLLSSIRVSFEFQKVIFGCGNLKLCTNGVYVKLYRCGDLRNVNILNVKKRWSFNDHHRCEEKWQF